MPDKKSTAISPPSSVHSKGGNWLKRWLFAVLWVNAILVHPLRLSWGLFVLLYENWRRKEKRLHLFPKTFNVDATILSRELAWSQQEALHNRESIASLKISVSMLCLDTLPLLRKIFPDVENHSLSMIYAHLFQGEFGRRSHCCSRQQRSIQNAFTTLQLFVILNNNLYFKEWEF